jgi:dienelactone hydrolase
LIGFEPPDVVEVVTGEVVVCDGFRRVALTIGSIPAFLLLPDGGGPFPAVLVHHQHANVFSLGKSEVVGLAGEPYQAFGPALARRGVAVLAYDVLTFEDRRGPGDEWLQHYVAMAHRLVRGVPLMRALQEDAWRVLSALLSHPAVDRTRVGALGHSMGATLTTYQAALDPRLAFACASGATCSFARRMADGTGLAMAELVPGLANELETHDLLAAASPLPMLIVTSDRDRYCADAEEVAARARQLHSEIEHRRFPGEHALDQTRFNAIVDWVANAAIG